MIQEAKDLYNISLEKLIRSLMTVKWYAKLMKNEEEEKNLPKKKKGIILKFKKD